MSFITFIYKIKNNNKTYYGKYVFDYISDDHEGLDIEIKPYLLCGINSYRKQKNLPKLEPLNIYIGILSFSSNKYIPLYSSYTEIKCFDFYYDNTTTQNSRTYVNGNLINLIN